MTTFTPKEAEIISPYICNIKKLYLFNSYEYELEMLRMFTQKILNCPIKSQLNTLMIDYLLLNRTYNYITANEMPLKKINNVENFIVRVHSNTKRGFKLLRDNILKHHRLPSYKIRNLKIVTSTLTPQCCDYLTKILPFIKRITVTPFDGYVYPNYVVNYCKDVILKRRYNKPFDSKFDVIVLEDWELSNDSGWIVRSEIVKNENSIIHTDDALLLLLCFVWGTAYTAVGFASWRKWYIVYFLLLLLIFTSLLIWHLNEI